MATRTKNDEISKLETQLQETVKETYFPYIFDQMDYYELPELVIPMNFEAFDGYRFLNGENKTYKLKFKRDRTVDYSRMVSDSNGKAISEYNKLSPPWQGQVFATANLTKLIDTVQLALFSATKQLDDKASELTLKLEALKAIKGKTKVVWS